MKNELQWFGPAYVPTATTIVVVYDGTSYAGVYSPRTGMVIRYPEDLPPVRLVDCERWCYLPK